MWLLRRSELIRRLSYPESGCTDTYTNNPASIIFFLPAVPEIIERTLIATLSLRCPFEAISIINLPTNLDSEVTHRYTANSFKLHRLPTPRPGQVLGLVGTNGIGKSTALKILAGKIKPNLGRYDVRLTSTAPIPHHPF